MNTPRSQGAVGFLQKAGKIELDDVTIESANEFGSVLVTALDDQPLASSKKILIQTITEEKAFGFQAPNGRITNLGAGPLNVRKIDVKVALKLSGDPKPKVTALDENGYGRSKAQDLSDRGKGVFDFTLSEDALYHVVQR
jgi:hypothetical protein